MARRSAIDELDDPLDYEEIAQTKADNQDRILKRIEEYKADFDEESLTTVDRLQIRQLAKLELAAEDATDALMGNLTPNQRKSLSDSAKSLIAEARQLADALGMTRKRRTQEGDDLTSYIPRLHKETQEFLRNRAVAIVCPHCREEKAHVEIKEGTIIYHFTFEGEWQWKSRCPRCKQMFTIDQNNYTEFKFDTLGVYEEKKREFEAEEDEETVNEDPTED